MKERERKSSHWEQWERFHSFVNPDTGCHPKYLNCQPDCKEFEILILILAFLMFLFIPNARKRMTDFYIFSSAISLQILDHLALCRFYICACDSVRIMPCKSAPSVNEICPLCSFRSPVSSAFASDYARITPS